MLLYPFSVRTVYARQRQDADLCDPGILNTAFVVTLNILFLAGFHMGIIGYVIAISIADLLCTTFLVFKERLWEYVTWKPDLSILKSMLKYSIPMIPTTIFWW